MSEALVQINVSSNKRQVIVKAPVIDSLHASMFADRLNKLPYLKAFDRAYVAPYVEVKCHTIFKQFSIEKLHNDLEEMSDIIILQNENI